MRGKRKHRLFARKIAGDHPRGCGENLYHNFRVFCRAGSPPRMRGKPSGRRSRSRKIRITPADAGKTPRRGSYRLFVRDHPRGCGENRLRAPSPHGKMGSPPQVRGKLSRSFGVKTVCRITPAGAGKTLRACTMTIAQTGSPPQVRGKLPACINCGIALRITPAGAGKTGTF